MTFLVVYKTIGDDVDRLNNVGVFDAETAEAACLMACDEFGVPRYRAGEAMDAKPLAELPDGWSYFE